MWVRICSIAEAPADGTVMEADAQGTPVCLARIGGKFSAVDNLCPHRQGPLGQGWIEGNAVVCPWHSWTFDPDDRRGGVPGQRARGSLPCTRRR